jgi:acyl dehydratase
MALLEPFHLTAVNLAKASENKMHDDAVARTYGFDGGLVPGVAVFGYLSHPAVARWGRAFLGRGALEAKFLKPVYDGDSVAVTAEEADDGINIEVKARGDVCPTGRAALPDVPATVALADFPTTEPVPERRPVDGRSYVPGGRLGTASYTLTVAGLSDLLTALGETHPIYAADGLAHPCYVLQLMNKVLMDNAVLGPWIHTSSTVRFLAPASATDGLTACATVTGNYERKGHRFVELDGLVLANGDTPIAHCRHTAIYQPRGVGSN